MKTHVSSFCFQYYTLFTTFHCTELQFFCLIQWLLKQYLCSILMMMMMINCFYGMVDWWKIFSLISRWNHCQRFSLAQFSDMPWARFEPAQNLSSWHCWMKLCRHNISNITLHETTYTGRPNLLSETWLT